jgi:hypothetical protein
MDQQTNDKGPSSTEDRAMKVGDKVWVLCEVVSEPDENGVRSCKPVEPEAVIKESLKTESDPVNPSHYKQGGIECIEAIKAALGEGFPDYLRGNVMKYLWRYKEKGGVEDLRKSAWYLDRLFKEAGE